MRSSAPPARSSDFEAFAAALDDFMRSIRRARGRFAGESELSLPQFQLLEPLAGGEALPVGAIAEAADVSAPTATRMLDGLEARGFVARVRGTEDRRVVKVAITDEGLAAVRHKRARILAKRAAVFERLSPGERREAARLLRSLAEAVEDLR